MISYELTPPQPLSNENFQIKLDIVNIGDSVFPGGEMTNFKVDFMQKASQTVAKSMLEKIPPMKPSETVKLKPETFFAFEDGSASVGVSLKANDGEEVRLFQNPEVDLGNNWINVFTVGNQDNATIIKLLQKIVRLLEERERKK